MLGYVAAAIFLVAFVISATPMTTGADSSPTSPALAGLGFLALSLTGVGTGWSLPGKRSKRRAAGPLNYAGVSPGNILKGAPAQQVTCLAGPFPRRRLQWPGEIRHCLGVTRAGENTAIPVLRDS